MMSRLDPVMFVEYIVDLLALTFFRLKFTSNCLQAYRWIIDSRDQHSVDRLDKLRDPFSVYRSVHTKPFPSDPGLKGDHQMFIFWLHVML